MRARFAALRDSYQQQLDTLHMQVIEMDSRNERKAPPQLPSQPFSQPTRMTAPSQHHVIHASHPFSQSEELPSVSADSGKVHTAPRSSNVPGGAHAYDLGAHAEGIWSSAREASLREERAAQVCHFSACILVNHCLQNTQF